MTSYFQDGSHDVCLPLTAAYASVGDIIGSLYDS